MKKLITTVCLAIVFALNVAAQVKMGLKVAPQLTWVTPESKGISAGSLKVNAAYGLMVDYYFNENYAFATELSVAAFTGGLKVKNAQVFRNGGTPVVSDVDYTHRCTYVSVPLLLRMRTKEIGYFRYFAEFGLDNAVLVRHRTDVSTSAFSLTDVNVNNPDKQDEYTIQTNDASPVKLDDDLSFFRSGLVIGAGLQYNVFGNTLLVGGLRYNNALNTFTSENNWKARMNGVSLTIGVLF